MDKKELKRLYDIEYRKKNREKILQNQKNWHQANPDKNKGYVKKHYLKHQTLLREKRKNYVKNNPDKISSYNKKYREKNKEIILLKKKEWRNNNKDYIKTFAIKNRTKKNAYVKNKRLSDNLFRLKENIKSLIRQSFKYNNTKKSAKTLHILGCSFEEFKQYIESKWEPWMNWDNYGKYNGELNYGWDIDHIIPLSSAETEEDIINLNHYSNLQPLCSYFNRVIKRNKKNIIWKT